MFYTSVSIEYFVKETNAESISEHEFGGELLFFVK